MQTRLVYTIGHSNHAQDHLLDLLRRHGIEVLLDTRSSPRSQFAPHFNGDALKAAVNESGIGYKFLGDELGGRPADLSLYDADGHALYSQIALTDAFRRGIELIVQEHGQCRLALLCSEENPSICHRRLLIARVLTEAGIPVVHIRGDGSIQTEEELRCQEFAGHQPTLFGELEQEWRSVLPIVHRRMKNR